MFKNRDLLIFLAVLAIAFLLFILALALLANTVSAQGLEPPEQLPPTAGEAVIWVQGLLVLLAGLAGNRITEWISQFDLGWLSKDDHAKARQIILDIVALLFSVGAGYALPYLTNAAEYLDTTGIWLIIVAAWPVCRLWFLSQKLTTNVGGLAKLAVVGTARR
jgi:hypothetical protein